MRGLRQARGAAVAGLLAGALVLGGCSEDIGERVAEKIAEEQLGDGAEVDIDADGGEVRIDDGNGSSYTGGTRLPDDFPGDVPLLEGEILTGSAARDGGDVAWTVSVQVAGDIQEAFDAAVGQLEGAGFELTTEIEPGLHGAQLDDGTWSVVITGYGDPSAGTAVVGYTVVASER